jgi:hypothetical protein
MKDLRELKYFLRIEVSKSKKDIFLSKKKKHVLDFLNETDMTTCSPTNTLVKENLKL